MAYIDQLLEIIKSDNKKGVNYDEYIERAEVVRLFGQEQNLHDDFYDLSPMLLAYEYIYHADGEEYKAVLDHNDNYTISIKNRKTNRWNIVEKNVSINFFIDYAITDINIVTRYHDDEDKLNEAQYLRWEGSFSENHIFKKEDIHTTSALPFELLEDVFYHETRRSLPTATTATNKNKYTDFLINDDTNEAIEVVIEIEYNIEFRDISYDIE